MTLEYETDQALEILSRTPTVLSALLEGLPPGWLAGDEGANSWSPVSVVAHLVHGERTDWVIRARAIMEKGDSHTFTPFDREAHLEEARTRSVTSLLSEFASLRRANIDTVRRWNLTPEHLEQRGRHPDFGPVTLRQLLATWVVHDLGHIGQIVRVMAKQYRDQVGPWEAYLPVLHR